MLFSSNTYRQESADSRRRGYCCIGMLYVTLNISPPHYQTTHILIRRLPGIAWTRRLCEDHEDHQQQPSPGTEHPFVLPGVGARRASATCGHSSRHCPREQSVGHEDLRLWGVWPPGPVADSGRRVLVVPARSPSRRGITAAVVVAVSAALVQQACVPVS
jgi:hypothetical protein